MTSTPAALRHASSSRPDPDQGTADDQHGTDPATIVDPATAGIKLRFDSFIESGCAGSTSGSCRRHRHSRPDAEALIVYRLMVRATDLCGTARAGTALR